jgi:hypothetical protein
MQQENVVGSHKRKTGEDYRNLKVERRKVER